MHFLLMRVIEGRSAGWLGWLLEKSWLVHYHLRYRVSMAAITNLTSHPRCEAFMTSYTRLSMGHGILHGCLAEMNYEGVSVFHRHVGAPALGC